MKAWFAIFRPISTGGMKRVTAWNTAKDRVMGAAQRAGLHQCGCVMLTIHAEKKPKAMHIAPSAPHQIPLPANCTST